MLLDAFIIPVPFDHFVPVNPILPIDPVNLVIPVDPDVPTEHSDILIRHSVCLSVMLSVCLFDILHVDILNNFCFDN